MASKFIFRHVLMLFLLHFTTFCTSTLSSDVHRRDAVAKGVDLRMLPLGDSITFGEGSTDGNGYRLALSELITNNGNNLNYIGSVKSGSMTNNENEGHGGFQIVPVGLTGKPDFAKRPNVVLFMAGTNDIIFNIDVRNAPNRLGAVVEGIVSECPDATVLVGTLTPLVNPGWMSKIEAFNAALPGVVSPLVEKGRHVQLVNMSRITISHIHTDDGIHPTDEAYALIAAAWYEGIVEVGPKGWIKQPLSEASPSQSVDHGSQETKDLGDHEEKKKAASGSKTEIATSQAQLLIYAVLLLGLVYTARKAAGIFFRRHRG